MLVGGVFVRISYLFGVDDFLHLLVLYSLHYLILPTVIHGFCADAHGLTMKKMLVRGVVRIYLDHGVRPPSKVCSLAHIAQQRNVGGGWCWWW